jgi:protein SCO1/2
VPVLTSKSTFWALMTLSLLLLFSLPILFYTITSNDWYGKKVDRIAPDFSLMDVQGASHSLSQHQGRYVYLYFGYLNCNDVCHNQVGVLFNLHHQSHADDIDFIFVTMDPQRDSPAMLKDYFNQFGTNFVSLTAANMQEIQKVASTYKAFFFKEPSSKEIDVHNRPDYEIAHPGAIYLIDRLGHLRGVYQGKDLRYDKMLEDLQKLKTSQ